MEVNTPISDRQRSIQKNPNEMQGIYSNIQFPEQTARVLSEKKFENDIYLQKCIFSKLKLVEQNSHSFVQINKNSPIDIKYSDRKTVQHDINLKKSHKLYQNTTKFIRKMKSLINEKIKSQTDLSYLNDKSYVDREKRINEFWLKRNQLIEKFRVFQVIQPEYKLYKLWEILVLLIIITQLLLLPFRLTFSSSDEIKENWDSLFLGNFAFGILIFDIILSFNTALYVKGIKIQDRHIISKRILKTSFFFDMISIISVLLVLITDNQSYNLLFIVKAFQIRQRLRKIYDYYQFQFSDRVQVTYELLLLFFIILVMAHIFGCGFYYIGQIEYKRQQINWIQESNIKSLPIMDQYVASMYFTFVSMITVGYGDIHPISTNEKLYVIFMNSITCGVFGYCINKIGQVKQYLKARDIPINLQCKIVQNIQYQIEKKQEHNSEVGAIIESIDYNLLKELKLVYYGNIIRNISCLKQNFSQQSLEQIALACQDVFYQKGDILSNQNQEDLFILTKGKAVMHDSNLDISDKVLIQEIYFQMKDLIWQNIVNFQSAESCVHCREHKKFNSTMRCNKYHPKINYKTCIDKYLSRQQQKRQIYYRNRFEKYPNSWIYLKNVRFDLKRIRIHFISLIQLVQIEEQNLPFELESDHKNDEKFLKTVCSIKNNKVSEITIEKLQNIMNRQIQIEQNEQLEDLTSEILDLLENNSELHYSEEEGDIIQQLQQLQEDKNKNNNQPIFQLKRTRTLQQSSDVSCNKHHFLVPIERSDHSIDHINTQNQEPSLNYKLMNKTILNNTSKQQQQQYQQQQQQQYQQQSSFLNLPDINIVHIPLSTSLRPNTKNNLFSRQVSEEQLSPEKQVYLDDDLPENIQSIPSLNLIPGQQFCFEKQEILKKKGKKGNQKEYKQGSQQRRGENTREQHFQRKNSLKNKFQTVIYGEKQNQQQNGIPFAQLRKSKQILQNITQRDIKTTQNQQKCSKKSELQLGVSLKNINSLKSFPILTQRRTAEGEISELNYYHHNSQDKGGGGGEIISCQSRNLNSDKQYNFPYYLIYNNLSSIRPKINEQINKLEMRKNFDTQINRMNRFRQKAITYRTSVV